VRINRTIKLPFYISTLMWSKQSKYGV